MLAVADDDTTPSGSSPLGEIVRESPRRMWATSLEAEVDVLEVELAAGPVPQRWPVVNAPHLVALVRAGARFERGRCAERPEAVAA